MTVSPLLTPLNMYNVKCIGSNGYKDVTRRYLYSIQAGARIISRLQVHSELRSLAYTDILQPTLLDIVVSSTAPAHPLREHLFASTTRTQSLARPTIAFNTNSLSFSGISSLCLAILQCIAWRIAQCDDWSLIKARLL